MDTLGYSVISIFCCVADSKFRILRVLRVINFVSDSQD